MTGKTTFSNLEIDLLRLIVEEYARSNNAADQKKARVKMRKIGFYVSDFNIKNITLSVFESLIAKGFVSNENSSITKSKRVIKEIQKVSIITLDIDFESIEKELINGVFKTVKGIDDLVGSNTGFYCIKIGANSKLPKRYQDHLDNRNHKIIYIGKAENQSLKKRFLGQELRAKGHGTFFRSIGAVLGYKPVKGSLRTAKNKNNYKFNTADQAAIINWINENLEVNWISHTGDFSIESHWISKYCPLLNDSYNPNRLEELRIDKANCRLIAIS